MPDLSGKGLEDLRRIMGPFVHHLAWRFACHHGDTGEAGRDASLLRQRRPGAVLFVLCDTEGKLARVPEGRAIELAGNAAEHIDQDQAQRAANGGISAVAVAEDAVGRVHADGGPYWAVDHDEWSTAASAGGAAMQV